MTRIFVQAHPSTYPQARGEGGRVALWDVHPDHPEGDEDTTGTNEVYISGADRDRVFEVGDSPRVMEALRNGRLIRLSDSEGESKMKSQERQRQEFEAERQKALKEGRPVRPMMPEPKSEEEKRQAELEAFAAAHTPTHPDAVAASRAEPTRRNAPRGSMTSTPEDSQPTDPTQPIK